MILLVSSSPKAAACAAALEGDCAERVVLAADLRAARLTLRQQEYAAIVLDQAVVELDERGAAQVIERASPAVPVLADMALRRPEKIARDTREALRRNQRQQAAAAGAAQDQLRRELNVDVTGILLSAELALSSPGLSPEAHAKLRAVHELALRMQSRLGMPATVR